MQFHRFEMCNLIGIKCVSSRNRPKLNNVEGKLVKSVHELQDIVNNILDKKLTVDISSTNGEVVDFESKCKEIRQIMESLNIEKKFNEVIVILY